MTNPKTLATLHEQHNVDKTQLDKNIFLKHNTKDKKDEQHEPQEKRMNPCVYSGMLFQFFIRIVIPVKVWWG